MPKVHLLDYAAGNIRSLVNAIEKLGWEVEWINSPEDVAKADVSHENLVYQESHTDS
jgi:imidazole glycerol-phosphate synthase